MADAIIELFRRRNTDIIFNKKALYINIKETVDVKTPKITKIADKLYDIYKICIFCPTLILCKKTIKNTI